jgi:hypothetical protein
LSSQRDLEQPKHSLGQDSHRGDGEEAVQTLDRVLIRSAVTVEPVCEPSVNAWERLFRSFAKTRT